MLSAWCEERGAHVLIPPEHVLGIVNGDDGMRVVYRCWCDAIGSWQASPTDAAGHGNHLHVDEPRGVEDIPC
jgi:hypothetical protein